jgi:DNA-binding response OmpR family regulator
MNKRKILIVDDEVLILHNIKIVLDANGYESMLASNGGQAVSLAHKERPDLIILDIMMPAMDGHMVFDKLKLSAHTWNIPVIFLTALGGKDVEIKAYEQGAAYFLRKPFDPKILLDTVKKALESSTYLAEHKELRKQILVIEKQQEVAELVKHQLGDKGYNAISVSRIEEGLDEIKREKIDLVIIDGMLAKENNYKDFYQLKLDDHFKKIPIIISYTKEELGDLHEKLEGVACYCLKPFDYIDLLGRIDVALKTLT